MAAAITVFDDLASRECDEALRRWVASGARLGDDPVRCPVTDRDDAARQRLDLALRMLRRQPVTQWCRSAGEGAAVVRSWPLPARGLVLHDEDGTATTLVLAVGRPQGHADVWRFCFDGQPCDVLDRGRALLAT